MFETAYLSLKCVKNLPNTVKVDKNVHIFGYFISPKNHNEHPKVAQLAQKLQNLVALVVS
jgi:hypothetical protein